MAPGQAAAAGPATFSYTGAEQTYTVPAGVTSINVVTVGAPGGNGGGSGGTAGGTGAHGALASAYLPVSPGEVLYVEVGGPGATGDFTGAGGFNGGGFGTGGGGGGGASDVRTCAITAAACPGGVDSPHSRLLVAGGGGAGSAAWNTFQGASGGAAGVVNGDRGSDGAGTQSGGPGGGGGGATLAAGGAGGASGEGGPGGCHRTSPSPGEAGGFGPGGASGASFPYGGGGGGGYWGGGGGGAGCTSGAIPAEAPGGGGGGGSSFGPPGVTSARDATGVPSVTIAPLPAPAEQVSPGSLSFQAQAQGTVGAPQTVTLKNTGPGALSVSGIELQGANPGDFFIGSSTCGGSVPTGSSCKLTVRFAPLAVGGRSATLVITGNDPASPATVALSGTGGQLPQGPPGAQGPAGRQGPSGKIELVTCKTVTATVMKTINHKRRKVRVTQQRCKTRSVSGTVKFTTSGTAARASISRRGVLYATGQSVPTGNGNSQLMLGGLRPLRPGTYTLTLQSRRRHRWSTSHTTITIESAVTRAS